MQIFNNGGKSDPIRRKKADYGRAKGLLENVRRTDEAGK